MFRIQDIDVKINLSFVMNALAEYIVKEYGEKPPWFADTIPAGGEKPPRPADTPPVEGN